MALKLFGKKSKGGAKKGEDVSDVGLLTPIEPRPDVEIDIENKNIVKVGKDRFGVGLTWKGYTSDSPKIQLEDIGSGDVINRNLYVTDKVSMGFGSTELGHKKGTIPLALILDESVTSDNFIGAFALGDLNEDENIKWWVVSKRNGIVTQDLVINNATQALDLVSAAGIGTSIRTIIPSDWGLSGSVEGELKDVLLPKGKKSKSASKLRRFGAIRNNLPAIIGIGLIGLLGGGGYAAYHYFETIRAEQEEQDRIRMQNRVRVEENAYPWFATVKPAEFIRGCQDAMESIVRFVPGWNIQPVICTMDSRSAPLVGKHRAVHVTASYERTQDGRIGWLRAAYGNDGDDRYLDLSEKVSMNIAGSAATISLPVDLAYDPNVYKNETPWEPDAITKNVVERFQNLGVPIQFNTSISTVRGRNTTPIFNNHSFVMATEYDPKEWIGLLADVPAAFIEQMTWNPGTGEWVVTGKIHHPAILPVGAY